MFFKQSALFVLLAFVLGFKSDPAFLHIEGLVTVDGKPAQAQIEINSVQKNAVERITAEAKKEDGNFISRLPAGSEYEIVVRVDHFPQQVIILNTIRLTSDQALSVFADFTSPEYDKKLEELITSTKELLKNKSFDTRSFASKYGSAKKEDLLYKVQIGAYKFYENFNYNNVLGLPKIIRKVENDQITRFTMGGYGTYNEAKLLLEKLQKANVKDAFIVAVYKDERKVLQQLIDENILE
ncbi:hypothetical protein CNR22_00930 [Sphingobacteriaceae bacterium]|nr:hypothetical protein CNR22_00930 [Sphingobacteriaceae bacterium]